MGLLYVCDEEGNRVAVIVPIEMWEKLAAGKTDKPTGQPGPSDYYGVFHHGSLEEVEKKLEDIRNEWDNRM